MKTPKKACKKPSTATNRANCPTSNNRASQRRFLAARLATLLGLLPLLGWAARAELRVPAFTAYTLPEPEAARISSPGGLTRWTDPAVSINWYGRFPQTGALTARLVLRLPAKAASRLRLELAGQAREAVAKGRGAGLPVTADFGRFTLPQPGYHRLALTSLNPPGRPFGDLEALRLDGPATDGAHFNLKERRNAASVHLNYPLPAGVSHVAAFYCEVTGLEDPTATFYMACGWHRGYFGLQVNSPTERRIICSVWDSGGEPADRRKVAEENRVRLLAKGEGVYAGDFGHEGTGGHSHLKYPWKTGEAQRFLVTAQPTNGTFTIYTGYWFHPEKKVWTLISSWLAPKDGRGLRHLHSFSENFWGGNGHLRRKALYGNQWIRTDTGRWLELTTATFSHDATGRADRLDRFMGVERGQFFLSHGGFVEGFTKYGEKFTRPATGRPPQDLDLPAGNAALPKPERFRSLWRSAGLWPAAVGVPLIHLGRPLPEPDGPAAARPPSPGQTPRAATETGLRRTLCGRPAVALHHPDCLVSAKTP